MLRNLAAEMLRNNITNEQLAVTIGRTTNNVRLKINNKSRFSIDESIAIRNKYFPTFDIDYLFAQINDK